jgi:SAM-dependent methyltransferase
MSGSSHYVHGSGGDEQRRLTTLNAFINRRMLPEMHLADRRIDSLIDFGSGLGQFTRVLATESGAARIVGIERDQRQIAEAMRQAHIDGQGDLVEFRRGDVMDPPLAPAEWGTFDIAHARFILEHVPDPLTVVKHMLRAVKPGGRVVVADDDHEVIRFWPALPRFEVVWRAYMQTYSEAGNDPIIGRRLVALLHAAGARPVRNTWVFFGACAGEETWPLVIDNCIAILQGAREEILRQPETSAATFDSAVRELRDLGTRPDGAMWYAIALAEGARPA